jgi:pyruvate,orthophosphate dikinase
MVRERLDAPGEPIACGVGAASGVAAGRIAFDSASADHLSSTGDPVILVRPDTSTADIAGFAASAGIVTAHGGRTAHAALVARQMGKPSIVGCEELTIDSEARRARFAGATIGEGEWITIDGDSGSIYLGRLTLRRERPTTELDEVERWRQQMSVDHAAA